LKQAAYAIIRPDSAPSSPGLLRGLFKRRPLFGVLSAITQVLDHKRQAKIKDEYAIDDDYFKQVQDYNADVTQRKVIVTTRRAEELFQALSVPARDLSKEKVLLIGPRNAHELIQAWVYGFSWDNIQGIDLYSTNPKISVMNMEEMEFADNTFDAVVMANTLAYAKDASKCISEIIRVLKPGGRAAFGSTFVSEKTEYIGNQLTGADLKAIFKELPCHMYYYRPLDKINAKGVEQTVHLIGLMKNDPDALAVDRIEW